MICGSGGSKSRLAKAAGAEPAGQMRDEKLHAVVARSTFASQNVQNTPRSEHFWLRCGKSARRCGAKHICKSKCTKHIGAGPLLEVEMSKKCTPLWREAHFQVKMLKTHHVRSTFGSWDVEKVHAVVARSTFRSQNVKSTRGEISWLWNLLAVKSLGCETSWLWDLLAVRSLCCEISWLWDRFAVRSLGCEVSWLWDLLAVRSLGCVLYDIQCQSIAIRNTEVKPSNLLCIYIYIQEYVYIYICASRSFFLKKMIYLLYLAGIYYIISYHTRLC